MAEETETELTLEELREDVEDLMGLWDEFGAEWGDRLAEASCELARRERMEQR